MFLVVFLLGHYKSPVQCSTQSLRRQFMASMSSWVHGSGRSGQTDRCSFVCSCLHSYAVWSKPRPSLWTIKNTIINQKWGKCVDNKISVHTIIPCPGWYSLTKTWLGTRSPNTPRSATFWVYTSSHWKQKYFENSVRYHSPLLQVSHNCTFPQM